jgi:dihydrofolate synthase/folylpolyglutamate synthase
MTAAMDNETAYQKTLDYLYSFVDYSLQRNFRNTPDKFDLGRMRALLESLGCPQDAYPIIHVAGTKGKGSVCAYCAAALQAAGYHTGLYTSPHLQDYAERIQIDDKTIPHGELVTLVDDIRPFIEAIPQLTTFEITTALAYLFFARQKVDAAIIEVGLGGRLDATNVCTPHVSVITSLSYDHTYLLGNTLAEIAAEKAGIIKPDIPVVLAPQKEEARLVVEKIATERNAPLFQIGKDFLFTSLSHSLEDQTMEVWPANPQSRNDPESALRAKEASVRLTIPLLGYHQVENAATAYAALHIARGNALEIDDLAIRKGFSAVVWPGRFEILRQNPPLIVDSAHNRDSALKLCLALDDYYPHYPVVLLFGASEDKDIPGMFDELLPRVREVICTKSIHPRAADPEKLAELARQFGKATTVFPSIEGAFGEALRLAKDDALILVTGSLFVVAAVREMWHEK